MKPATAVSTRNGRVAFVLGGGLFIASSVALALETGQLTLGVTTPGFGQKVPYMAFYAAGVIVVAWGVRGEGSVVARKPLGVAALTVFGLAPLLQFVLLHLPYATGFAWSIVVTLLGWFSVAAAGVVGVVQIVRVRAVPGGWRWMPAIVFSLGCIAWVFYVGQAWTLSQDAGSRAADAGALVLLFLVEFAGAVLMGLVAIGLAISARSRPDVPTEPATDPTAL